MASVTQPVGNGAKERETMSHDSILSVRNLTVKYRGRRGEVQAVRNVSFDLHRGENLALIGESGCGKTTLGLTLVGLLSGAARVTEGKIIYRHEPSGNAATDRPHETDLLTLSADEFRRFRWRECAMVFQAALNAFNPVLRIFDQFVETAKAHGIHNRPQIRREALELLRLVQLDPNRVIDAYPHELSGGMRQRVLIAMSLLLKPKILILDEPTTALDILTQRTIIDLMRRLKEEFRFSMIFISHDLALGAELADRVATMYAGRIVELSDVESAFYRPKHPYTYNLIRSVPTVYGAYRELTSIPGSPPDLISPPVGCAFHPRCQFAAEACRRDDPELLPSDGRNLVACLRWESIAAQMEEDVARPVEEAKP